MKTIGANIVLEGEQSYREALKTITGQQKALASEMALTSAEFEGQQNSLEALEKKYDILGDQIEKQKEKMGVYTDALDSAKERQAAAAEAAEKYGSQLEEARKELDEMRSSSGTTEEALTEQSAEVERLTNSYHSAGEELRQAERDVAYWQTSLNTAGVALAKMEGDLERTEKYIQEAAESADGCAKSIDGFGKEAEDAGQKAATFGDVLKANLTSEVVMAGLQKLADLTKEVGKGLYEVATGAAFWADNVATLSTNTGIATDTIQALYYAEELLDTSVETVTSSMAKNIRSMQSAASGTESYKQAYDKLGVSIQNADGSLRDSEEVFWDVIDALGQIENTTERDAVSMTVFGRSAQSLNSLVAAGSKGFQEMYKEADQLGYILDNDTLDGLVETSDAIERVNKTLDAAKNMIGAEVAPVVADAAEDLQRLIEDNAGKVAEVVSEVIPALVDGLEFVAENLDTILPVVEGVAAGFITFQAATKATEMLNSVLALLPGKLAESAAAQEGLNLAQSVSPMGALAVAAGLLVSALGLLFEKTGNYTPYVAELSKEEQALVQAMSGVNEQAKNHRDAFEQNVSSMAANRQQAQELTAKLKELEPAAAGDAEKMREMQMTVDQLNGLMPGLGLSVNEATGELNMGTEAIEAYTDALMRQIEREAYAGRLSEIIQDRIDVQNQLNDSEDAYNEAIGRVNKAFEERNTAQEAYQTALATYQDGLLVASDMEIEALRLAAEAAQANAEQVAIDTEQVRGHYQGLQGQLEELEGEYGEYQDLLADTYAQDAAAEANAAMTESVINWHGYAIPAVDGVDAKLAELAQKYDEAKAAAEESLRSQMGLFDEYQTKSHSIDEMTSGLKSQTDAMTSYGENLQKALDLDIDPEIIHSIEEMGLSGAGYLEALVQAAEAGGDELSEFISAWEENQRALDELSSSLAEYEVGYEESVGLIVEAAQTASDELLEGQEEFNETYVQGWTAVGEDSAQAVADAEPVIVENVTMLASSAITALNTEFGLDGEGGSSKGYAAGQSFGGSIAKGIEDMEDEIVGAVDRVGAAAVSAASEWARRIDEALGEAL